MYTPIRAIPEAERLAVCGSGGARTHKKIERLKGEFVWSQGSSSAARTIRQHTKEGTTTSNSSNYAFNVGLVVGGSIIIPHLRRAVDRLDECGKWRRGRRN
ncbi:MAG: hypothetical protein ABSF63_08105 [Candidatus Bathyarchaeia archaeon]